MASETLRAVAEANLRQALRAVRVYPAVTDTIAMLDRFDAAEYREFYDALLAGLGYGLVHYEPTTRVCETCGRWRCDDCGWTRQYANYGMKQVCGRCDSRAGKFRKSRHRRDVWEQHNPERTWPEATWESP
jgi:hypothetical protein